MKAKGKKNDDQLIRFVWKRNLDFDYFLLLEVQKRNPYSFVKPKPVWEQIASTLREGKLKMRVTERGCRDRVGELLKKHRKEESEVIRSTGAADDKTNKIKKLLTTINEMSLTKPDKLQSSLHRKSFEKSGERIRQAALSTVSDSDSDDYIQGNYSRSDLNQNTRNKSRDGQSGNTKFQFVRSVNGLFGDENMSLEEEERMLEEERLMEEERLREEGLSDDHNNHLQSTDQQMDSSWKDIPSTSRDYRYSVPAGESSSQIIILEEIDRSVQAPLSGGDPQIDAVQNPVTQTQGGDTSTRSTSLSATDQQMDSSWKDIPSTSRDYRYSVPAGESSSQIIILEEIDRSVQAPLSGGDPQIEAVQSPLTQTQGGDTSTRSTSLSAGTTATHARVVTSSSMITTSTTGTGNANASMTIASLRRDGTITQNVGTSVSFANRSTPNNRFSNPKKDFIQYLEMKCENETQIRIMENRIREVERKEENRIRQLEVNNKKAELEILRIKTEAEIAERKESLELEAQNRREELQIQRIRVEAEAEERKKMQELLMTLITKNIVSNENTK